MSSLFGKNNRGSETTIHTGEKHPKFRSYDETNEKSERQKLRTSVFLFIVSCSKDRKRSPFFYR